MNCPSCGFENPDGIRFCGSCAQPLRRAASCPSCGFENPPGFKFCGECATALAKEQPTRAPERTPRDYTPRHLADKILRSKSALEGERKQVTVLFADVKGSLELAEQVDAEEWHRIMDRFFQILADGVHRFEGTVNQYTGDGIMALFGAPIAHEDHAQRACWAALSLRDALRGHAHELRREQGLDFSVRMGLNSGEVVVGKIGDDLRMDYTARGHTVGLAGRMEQLAEAGKVYLTAHTAALVSGYFELEDLGEFKLKGAAAPLRGYALVGPGALRTRLDLSRARGLSKFVGRADEMATLEAALERAIAGQGQVVGVVAEAGTGKSRLCYEFNERCRSREIPIQEGHGVAHGKMIPFLPVLELLRGLFEIAEQDSPRTARTKIAGALLLLDREFEPALPLMFDFLGVSDPENPVPTMPPEARQRQLFGVVQRIIRARGERQPAVILIEDLHWIDGGTEAFLGSAVEAVAGTRTLLLVSFRPEYRADWMQKSYYQQIPLLPLGSEAVRQLLDDLLGRDRSLAGLAERIHERTGGNPFFIEEVVQSLAEVGCLEGRRGAYRLVRAVEELELPATVQAVLAARIDRLAEREKRLLQIAAVIGKRFSEGLLERVAALGDSGLADADRADALRALVAAEFLYEEALYPEVEYAFKHPLTQEVAYASQLGERRAGVHAAVSRAIESRDSNKLDERAALLAHHWEQAGESREAARWHRRAAEWAGLGQPSEAFAHWHRVRALLAPLPRSPEADELGAVACSQLLYMGARVAAAPEEMEALFREGNELARRSGNDAALAQLASGYGTYLFATTGIPEDAQGHVSRGVELADRTGDLGLRIAARYNAAFVCRLSGPIERTLAVTAEGIDLAGDDLDVGADLVGYSPWAGHRILRSEALCSAGRFREAGALVEALCQFPRERADPVTVFLGPLGANERFRVMGDPARAIDSGRQAVALAEAQDSQPMRILGYHGLGAALVLGGQWDEARSALEHALALIEEGRTFRMYEGLCLASLAKALLGGGELERARDAAEAALRVGVRHGLLPECEARLAVAHVLIRAEGAAAAEEIGRALDRAAKLVDLSGARSYEPLVHEARAELARVVARDALRDRELRQAHRLYTEMGATGHAERLAKELGL